MVCAVSSFSKSYEVIGTCLFSFRQFFEQRVCDYVDGQLINVTFIAHFNSLLARGFSVRFPEDSHFMTQHKFRIQCLHFEAVFEPKVRQPFNRPGKDLVYEKLQRISIS
ncbi:hypothetical protein P9112_002405 [Eukaryota sp. TZLM1-RC]